MFNMNFDVLKPETFIQLYISYHLHTKVIANTDELT